MRLLLLIVILVSSFAVAQLPTPIACGRANLSCEQKSMLPCSIQAWKYFRSYGISWGCEDTTIQDVSACDIAWMPECCWSGGPNNCVTPFCPCEISIDAEVELDVP